MFLIIDNYDSFTYNLYQYIGEILKKGVEDEIKVFRNDEITVEEIRRINPKGIIISPGPGSPENSGVTIEVIKSFGKEIPILGICLGHQAIAYCHGGEVLRANEIKHGKTSIIKHTGKGIFDGIKNPLKVMRYHSLTVNKESLPKELSITAETEDGVIMGLQHKEYPIYGLQFHPESILTEEGKNIIKNFIEVICND